MNDLSIKPFIPDASASIGRVYVSQAMRHPNIFRRRILHVEGNPRPGDWVAVYSEAPEIRANEDLEAPPNGEPWVFGYGIYNPKSSIAVRLMTWGPNLPTEASWDRAIDAAIELRHTILKIPQYASAYRLIHGEADGFPGIVVDRYADCLSAEVFSLGMMQRSQELMRRLCQRLGVGNYLIRPCPGFASQEGIEASEINSGTVPGYVTVMEGSTKYRIHFDSGHKTGFFCDQRDNRRILAEFAPGKTVLDLCCYTGGFSVRAASEGQAGEVTGVDIDEEPLKVAKKNAHINNAKIRFCQNDAFAFMRDMLQLGRQYDIVVLDPPKLIRSRAEIEEGTRKHYDLNKLAMQLVKPGGLMLSCTCAGLLTHESFNTVLHSAAKSTGRLPDGSRVAPRSIQILQRVGASADHPIAIHCPETEYFKSAWMRIE